MRELVYPSANGGERPETLILLVFLSTLSSAFTDVLSRLFRIISVKRDARGVLALARRITNPKIDSRSARTGLSTRREPYWAVISLGCALGYRRTHPCGSWIARFRSRQLNRLSFAQAQVRAGSFFDRRAKELAGDIEPGTGSFSVAAAISRYLESYRRRGGKSLDKMESVARTYILPDRGALALVKLSKGRIEKWYEGIATSPPRVRGAKGKPNRLRAARNGVEFDRKRRATANRALTVLKAALNNAYHDGLAAHDDAWRRVKAYRNVDAARGPVSDRR